MNKLKIIILIVIVVAGISFVFWNRNTEGSTSIKEMRDAKLVVQQGTHTITLSPEMYASVIRDEAKNKNRSDYPAEEDVGGRIFLDAQVSSRADMLIMVIGEEWLSGSGGNGGVVLVAKSDGSGAHVAGWFSSYLDKSLRVSPEGEYAMFTESNLSELCIARSYKLVNIKSSTVENINIPKDIALTKKIKLASEQFDPAVWTSDNTVQLDIPLKYCATSLDAEVSVDTIRYNIATGEITYAR